MNVLANITSLASLQEIRLPEIVGNLVLTVPENLTCADLTNYNVSQVNWEALMTNSKWNSTSSVRHPQPVLGYDFKHIGCKSLKFAIMYSPGYVLTMNFGDKIGVPESSVIYQKEMNFIKKSNKDFINSFKNDDKDPNVVYRTSSGDQARKRLLIDYGFKWTSDEENADRNHHLVFPVMTRKIEISKANNFSVVPYFGGIVCGTKLGPSFWYKPSALEAISDRFESIVLTEGMHLHI